MCKDTTRNQMMQILFILWFDTGYVWDQYLLGLILLASKNIGTGY